MKIHILWLLCCIICIQIDSSASIFNKFGEVGNAVKNLGSSLFGKLTGNKAPPLPGTAANPGSVLEQLEFLNNMLKQVHSFMGSPTQSVRQQMKPFTKTLVSQVIPQFDKLNFSDDELKIHHKLTPEQILKFRALLGETKDMFQSMKESLAD